MAAAVASLGVVLLHFIVTRRSRSIPFPTARFVPDVPVEARARSLRFSDLLLLAVRVLTILAVGAALARPVFPPHRERVVRVIAADVSGSVANVAEIRDSVRALYRTGDAIVVFDTAAHSLTSPDSVVTKQPVDVPGSLSAGLIGALRQASRVRSGADSVELVLVSPVTSDERDRATSAIRAQWRGRARLVAVAPNEAVTDQPEHEPRFLGADRPLYAVARNRIDTAGAVIASGHVLVAPFERRWRFTADSLAHAKVIARWADGEPAAIERDSAQTCTKSIAIPIDTTGDMTVRPGFVRFRASIAASCQHAATPPDAVTAKMLAGTGRLASVSDFAAPADIESPLARWLAALALILAIGEMALRRASRMDAGR